MSIFSKQVLPYTFHSKPIKNCLDSTFPTVPLMILEEFNPNVPRHKIIKRDREENDCYQGLLLAIGSAVHIWCWPAIYKLLRNTERDLIRRWATGQGKVELHLSSAMCGHDCESPHGEHTHWVGGKKTREV